MSREPLAPVKRKPLTRAQAIELACRQKGLCGCGCGVALQPLTEGVVDEHVVCLEYRQEWANDLRNRALYRRPCAATKTKTDQGGIAKAKRLAGEGRDRKRKKIPSRPNPWGPSGSRKLKSRNTLRKP